MMEPVPRGARSAIDKIVKAHEAAEFRVGNKLLPRKLKSVAWPDTDIPTRESVAYTINSIAKSLKRKSKGVTSKLRDLVKPAPANPGDL